LFVYFFASNRFIVANAYVKYFQEKYQEMRKKKTKTKKKNEKTKVDCSERQQTQTVFRKEEKEKKRNERKNAVVLHRLGVETLYASRLTPLTAASL